MIQLVFCDGINMDPYTLLQVDSNHLDPGGMGYGYHI